MVEKDSDWHTQNSLCARLELRCVEGGWLTCMFHEVDCRSDENWKLFSGCRILPNVTKTKNAQAFRHGIVVVQAFHKSKDFLVPQHPFSRLDVSVTTMDVVFCQQVRANQVLRNVHITGCHELLVVPFFKRDGKVQDRCIVIQISRLRAHILDHVICKLALLIAFSCADRQPVFSSNETEETVFLDRTYAILYPRLWNHH